MRTYLYTHNCAVITLQRPDIFRKSIFLLFSTLITFAVFAGEPSAPNNASNNAEFSLPLVLKTFNVVMNNKKAQLSWVTGHEKDLSHFVIERSTNGIDYTETSIVFALGNLTAVQNYNFSDPLNASAKGVIYYRLKLIDSRKRFQYSPVRLIRLSDASGEMKVQAYPNPVVNELRITVPSSWQNKQVSYEIYNLNGSLLKRITTLNASQTETLNMKELGTGTYVVKAYTQTESASERIVKR
jgi:hypothetical protein